MPHPTAAVAAPPLRILAIDDSPVMLGLLSRALRPAGFAVTLAGDGIEGLVRLRAERPDLILSDLNMPRLDGFGFIRAVRGDAAHAGLPILVVSTESSPELQARARALGATGWIVKPFDDVGLVAAVRRVTAAAVP